MAQNKVIVGRGSYAYAMVYEMTSQMDVILTGGAEYLWTRYSTTPNPEVPANDINFYVIESCLRVDIIEVI